MVYQLTAGSADTGSHSWVREFFTPIRVKRSPKTLILTSRMNFRDRPFSSLHKGPIVHLCLRIGKRFLVFCGTSLKFMPISCLFVGLCHLYALFASYSVKTYAVLIYISCRINETVMTVALQHLLNKMIDNTPPDGCINIILSHSASSWELRISNCEKIRNGILKMIPPPCKRIIFFTVHKSP